jgi:AraC family transcriptional regulator of adaptative response/methylated-DNA-[protein]-cysteine methyltransferase
MNSYETMAAAIDVLVAENENPPDLQKLADRFDCEPTVFQKTFQSYVGVSPKQLQRFLSLRTARDFLLKGYSTLEAAYAAGLSGNGRLHDLCVLIDAATPGELREKGKGIQIDYGWGFTPFGSVLIGRTARGICWLSFELTGERELSEALMKKRFLYAEFIENLAAIHQSAERIVELWQRKESEKIRLNLYGTNFQLKVWEALLKIPSGGCVSYSTIAENICSKKASRAVGSAIGANPVSFLIPCHRVIQQSGIVENYAWGSERKRILLGIEGFGPNS